MARRPVRICLLWHSLDSGNLGVQALTESQLHLIRSAASSIGREVCFEVVGWASSTDTGPYQSKAIVGITPVCGRSMLSSNGVRATLRRADVVLDIGEGDSFTDIYGAKRLAYFSATKILASLFGRPLILCPQTIGPFTRWWSRLLADYCMNRAEFVFPRDELSYRYLQTRHLRIPIEEMVDVAFALPFARPEAQGASRPRIGINVSGLLWSGGYTGKNQFGLTVDYPALTRRLIRHFSELVGAEVILVPHVVGDKSAIDGDIGVSEQLLKEFPAISVAPVFSGPSEAKSYISGLDFFVGARMHACIAAFSSGVPVVPLAYSRKFTGLFATLGYPHVADCQRQSNDEVADLVTRTYADSETVRESIARGNQVAEQRLAQYVGRLSDLLARLP